MTEKDALNALKWLAMTFGVIIFLLGMTVGVMLMRYL